MNTLLTWRDASKLSIGDRVVFPDGWDIYPWARVDNGEAGTVVENSLNELHALIGIKPDNADIRKALKDWDGDIILTGTDAEDNGGWDTLSPLAKLSADQDADIANALNTLWGKP